MSKRRVLTPCAAASLLALGLLVSLGEARVTWIETTLPRAIAEGMPSSPAAAGKLLPLALDPADSRNAVLQYLDGVPTNAAGKVFGKDAAPVLGQAESSDVPQEKSEPEATEEKEEGGEKEEEEEEEEPEEDEESES